MGARDCIAFPVRWLLSVYWRRSCRLASRGRVPASRKGPRSSRVDLKGSRSSPPGAQLLASERAAPVCRSRARTRRPCTRRRAQGERHRPACLWLVLIGGWTKRMQGQGRYWRPLPVTQRSGKGGASSGRDTTKRGFFKDAGRHVGFLFTRLCDLALYSRVYTTISTEAAKCFHIFG